jgi:hypothetical protein
MADEANRYEKKSNRDDAHAPYESSSRRVATQSRDAWYMTGRALLLGADDVEGLGFACDHDSCLGEQLLL